MACSALIAAYTDVQFLVDMFNAAIICSWEFISTEEDLQGVQTERKELSFQGGSQGVMHSSGITCTEKQFGSFRQAQSVFRLSKIAMCLYWAGRTIGIKECRYVPLGESQNSGRLMYGHAFRKSQVLRRGDMQRIC